MPASRAHRSEGGFTISEVVAVLVVLAGLVWIITTSIAGLDDDEASRECRTELRTLKAATEQFRGKGGFYPENDQMLESAEILDRSETPNWRVVTGPDGDPTFEPEGDRCEGIAT
jgi:type II secretory pathway pseudopilin PulG